LQDLRLRYDKNSCHSKTVDRARAQAPLAGRNFLAQRLQRFLSINPNTRFRRDGTQPYFGNRKSMPRSSFALVVACTFSSAIGIFRARCSVNTHSVFPTIA
jgi:hypothetical protein